MEIEHYAVPDTNIQDSHFCTSEEDNIGRNIVYIKSCFWIFLSWDIYGKFERTTSYYVYVYYIKIYCYVYVYCIRLQPPTMYTV